MSHGIAAATVALGRIVAAVCGATAFYFAFFLYENEQGLWQNRVEMLWISIADRAKTTDSVSAAVFNRIAAALQRNLDSSFGRRLLSLRACAASITLSVGGFCLYQMVNNWRMWKAGVLVRPALILELLLCGAISLASLGIAKKWDSKWSLVPLYISAALVVGATLYVAYIGASGVLLSRKMGVHCILCDTMISLPLLLLIWLISDVLTIALIRQIFRSMSLELRRLHVLRLLVALGAVAVALVPLPYWLASSVLGNRGELSLVLSFVMELNFTTFLLSVCPLAVLLILLLHKVFWPILCRALYPIASRKLVTNPVVLIPIGSFCFAAAAGIQHINPADILKLFAH